MNDAMITSWVVRLVMTGFMQSQLDQAIVLTRTQARCGASQTAFTVHKLFFISSEQERPKRCVGTCMPNR